MKKIFHRRNSLRLRILHQSTSQPSRNLGEQDNDQSVGWDSDNEDLPQLLKSDKESEERPNEDEEEENESQNESPSPSKLELPVILFDEDNGQNESSGKHKSFSFMDEENDHFEQMVLNDEEGFPSSAPVSQLGRLESEEMTKDLSKIMSESDLISNSKPTKNIRIKPTQKSFLQELCQ